ncbi:MAG: VacJ family lipoprotein [Burkholderiaceae bacterium]
MIGPDARRGRLRPWVTTLLLVFSLAGAGCATIADGDPSDPLEPWNRKVHAFNMALDEAVLAPVARGYRDHVNPVFRMPIRSFFSNLEDIWISANNLLQGKPVDAAQDLSRVMLNTTLGLFGLVDVASEIGFAKHREDFGQTLGVWGVPPGPYIVLPFFGPSNGRDAIGFGVDSYGDPIGNVFKVSVDEAGARTVRIIDEREALLNASKLLPGIALDEYSFIRDAYMQRRRSLVYDGDPPMLDEPAPRYDDEDDKDDKDDKPAKGSN